MTPIIIFPSWWTYGEVAKYMRQRDGDYYWLVSAFEPDENHYVVKLFEEP